MIFQEVCRCIHNKVQSFGNAEPAKIGEDKIFRWGIRLRVICRIIKPVIDTDKPFLFYPVSEQALPGIIRDRHITIKSQSQDELFVQVKQSFADIINKR